MKRGVIAALAAIGLLAVGGVASAANRYDLGVKVSPAAKGSPTRPVPVSTSGKLRVFDTNPENRAAALQKYWLGTEGVVAFPNAFPKCSFADANRAVLALAEAACGRAKIGHGTLEGVIGSPESKLLTDSQPCNLELTVYNLGSGHLAARLDGDPPAPALGSGIIGCGLPAHAAIPTRLVTKKIGGLKSSAYELGLPENLRRPVGLEAALVSGTDHYPRMTAMTKLKGVNGRVKVGFFSSVGCRGNTRTTQANYIEEDGRVVSVTARRPC